MRHRRLGQWTPPFLPTAPANGDDREWWQVLIDEGADVVRDELGPDYPSTHPYGPGTPQWGGPGYPPELHIPEPGPTPAPSAPAPSATGNALTALAIAGVGWFGLRAAGLI